MRSRIPEVALDHVAPPEGRFETRNHVLSAKLCHQWSWQPGFHRSPWKLSFTFNQLTFNLLTFNLSTSKHRCHSLLFRPLQSKGTQPLQMAGSPKKGSTKSPKGGRKAKAAATPETKSVVVNNEDCNIRSSERTQLLTQIKGILNNAPVSPTFWACCQLADMNCLQELATTNRKMILLIEKPLCTLPMQCELLGF
jgi:hypothetical protein